MSKEPEFRFSHFKRLHIKAPSVDDETMRKVTAAFQRQLERSIAEGYGVPAELWVDKPPVDTGWARQSFKAMADRLEAMALVQREWQRLQYERALSMLLIIYWRKVRAVAILKHWCEQHIN